MTYMDDSKIWDQLLPYLEEEKPCIICKSQTFEVWAKIYYLEAKKCKSCGMISVNPHFSDEGLKLLYNNYFKERQKNVEKKTLRDLAYVIDRDWVSLFVKGGEVLDVGCSGGLFLSKFSPEHWERCGVEIAHDCSEYAQKLFDIPVYVGDIVDINLDNKFDLVMLRGTVEHLNNPISVLLKCSMLIKKNGYLYIAASPAGNSFAFEVYREKWGQFTPLEHIHFFTVKLLDRVLRNLGLGLVTFHYPYEETPYASITSDFEKIKQDIVKISQGRRDEITGSVPFPGSVFLALWKKVK